LRAHQPQAPSFQGSRLGRESSKNRAADVYWERLQTEALFWARFPPVFHRKNAGTCLTGFEKKTGGEGYKLYKLSFGLALEEH